MKLWIDFANTGVPASYWPKYNRIERKALVLGEESVSGEHRIITDVRGTQCRLIDEAKTVAGRDYGTATSGWILYDLSLKIAGLSSAHGQHTSAKVRHDRVRQLASRLSQI
ncbi:hypothetical protein GCK32_012788 [Trichostrongylus colubriformis]|uniref:Uncharacterized protein n=1 Tax=Trichostrongylus colubriformis TaxID=6319 RepID=A0AAN8FWB0_TRICO